MNNKIDFRDWDKWAKELGGDQPFKSYQPQQLWWPLSTSINEWDFDFHRLMLADRVRMVAYHEAIGAAIRKRASIRPVWDGRPKEPLRVLDIGCGTGILMRFAADAWETVPADHKSHWAGIRIYGVERDPGMAISASELLSNEGNPHGRILWRPELDEPLASAKCAVVLTCRSDILPQTLHELQPVFKRFDSLSLPSDPTLAPVFDIIVTETIGGLGDDEDIVLTLERAGRTLAAANCCFIPQRLESFIAPVFVQRDQNAGLLALWTAEWRSAVNSINAERYDPNRLLDPRNVLWDTIVPEECCGPPLSLGDWTFAAEPLREGGGKLATSYAAAGSFTVSPPLEPWSAFTGKYFIGFKGWFSAALFDDVALTTAGAVTNGKTRTSLDCWKHRFAPLDDPIAIQADDVIDVIFSREETYPPLDGYTYRWRGRVSRNGWLVDRFDQAYLIKGPSVSPRQHAAPRPLGRRTFDYLIAMLLALLFGLLVEAAIKNLGEWYTVDKRAHVRWQHIPQAFLLFALAINLVRVAHSAFVLAEDRVFHDERINSQKKHNLLAIVPHTLRRLASGFARVADGPAQLWPTSIVAFGVLMLALRVTRFDDPQPQVVLWYAVLCSGLLSLWDFLPWLRFRSYLSQKFQPIAESNIEAASVDDAVLLGSIDHRQLVIRDVLRWWLIFDVSFIALGVVYLFLQRAFSIDIWEVLFACILLVGCAFDWLLGGWRFYFQSPEYER